MRNPVSTMLASERSPLASAPKLMRICSNWLHIGEHLARHWIPGRFDLILRRVDLKKQVASLDDRAVFEADMRQCAAYLGTQLDLVDCGELAG